MSCSEQTFHGQAFDRVWSFQSSPFKRRAEKREKKKKEKEFTSRQLLEKIVDI
jgi:hypothetical protein